MSSDDLASPSLPSMTHYSSILELSFKENNHNTSINLLNFLVRRDLMVDGWKSFLKRCDAIKFSRASVICVTSLKELPILRFVEKENKMKFWFCHTASRMVLTQ